MSNVAKLPNAQIKGEPDGEIIELMERYLEQAKRGEVVGVAIALVRPNGNTTRAWQTAPGFGHHISTCILTLGHDYARAWQDEDE